MEKQKSLDLAVETGVIDKSGSWYSYEGNKLGQGRDYVREYLRTNPEWFYEVELKIKEKLGIISSETLGS